MSEDSTRKVPKILRGIRNMVRLFLGLFLAVVLLGFFVGEAYLIADFAVALFAGWFTYLTKVLPRVHFNAEIALGSLLAIVLATIGLHRIMKWWRRSRGGVEEWRAGWTIKIAAMMLLLFATSIVATGIVHQIGWLFRAEQVTYNAGVGLTSEAMNKVKQVMTALKIYAQDHNEMYPLGLDELVPKYSRTSEVFFVRHDRNEPPERIVYFPGYKNADSAETVVVFSPRPIRDMRVIGQSDGAVKVIDESYFRVRLQQQFGEKLPPAVARALQVP